MPALARAILVLGALAMAVGVGAGAWAAHAAKDAQHPDAPRLLQTAVTYMLVHGLGMIAVGVLARPVASGWLVAAALLFLVGIVVFCGSLWGLAMTGRSLGVAPIGGIAFIAGWLAIAAWAWLA